MPKTGQNIPLCSRLIWGLVNWSKVCFGKVLFALTFILHWPHFGLELWMQRNCKFHYFIAAKARQLLGKSFACVCGFWNECVWANWRWCYASFLVLSSSWSLRWSFALCVNKVPFGGEDGVRVSCKFCGRSHLIQSFCCSFFVLVFGRRRLFLCSFLSSTQQKCAKVFQGPPTLVLPYVLVGSLFSSLKSQIFTSIFHNNPG